MSFGTYQPFDPTANTTANTGIGNEFGRVVGNSVVKSLFGQDGQGPLSGLTRGLPGAIMNNVVGPAADRLTSGKNLQGIGQGIFNDNLPGAPSPEARQNVERSQATGGILKLRQQPPMLGQQPGGKSSSGKAFAAPNLYNQAQPEQTQTDVNQTMGRPDVTKEMFGLPQSNFYNGQ